MKTCQLQSFRSGWPIQFWYKVCLHPRSYEEVMNFFGTRPFSGAPRNRFLRAGDIIAHIWKWCSGAGDAITRAKKWEYFQERVIVSPAPKKWFPGAGDDCWRIQENLSPSKRRVLWNSWNEFLGILNLWRSGILNLWSSEIANLRRSEALDLRSSESRTCEDLES
jgi:hypothetical protein